MEEYTDPPINNDDPIPVAIYGEPSDKNPNTYYMIAQYKRGFTCDCPAFVNGGWRTGRCKHIDRVKERIKKS
jgi:hypothetical protein